MIGASRNQVQTTVSSEAPGARVARTTAEIIRPLFKRWMPVRSQAESATGGADAGDTCEIVALEICVDRNDLQAVQAGIEDCRNKLKDLECSKVQIESSRRWWAGKADCLNSRLRRACDLQESAQKRVTALEKQPSNSSQSALRESYQNFVMQAELLQLKHSKALQVFSALELQHQQATVQMHTQTNRLQQLLAMQNNDDFQQAA